jgi:hypothetical protein
MTKQISKVWTFASDSNPNIEYETLQYVDGTTSCNCKGWTRRVAADGTRSCKHSRFVVMGIADDHCTATHNYQNQQQQTRKETTNGKNPIFNIPRLGHRKFAL